MAIVKVSHLVKHYQVHEKEPGLKGSLKSLFARKYKDVKAVNDISFSIEKGELVGFIGPNGAGKTTTLKCLSGLLYPTSGKVEVLGHTPWDRKPAFQKQFALVMGQKNQLWWDLPAIETFNLNKEIYEVPQVQYKKTLSTLVELLDVQDILKVQVRRLSLGQRMKCELIAALLHNPKVLFLDEPTIGLDVVMQKVMRDFIKEYNREFNSTIILTSHYMGDVKELCQRVIIIDHGQVMFDGALKDVIQKYARNKILTVTFNQDVKKSDLQVIGDVRSFEPPSARINVPRQDAPRQAAKLLTDFPVADINIEEPPIEAIIREAFAGTKE
jgi:ABC-2 type transport system ATP-binding protein